MKTSSSGGHLKSTQVPYNYAASGATTSPVKNFSERIYTLINVGVEFNSHEIERVI